MAISGRTRRYGEGSDPARDATLDLSELQRPPSGLVAGDAIGRYRILSVIGRGGMGTVYAAHDSKLDRNVALKVLHDEHLSDGAQLVQEAQALARLADPHVVTVYDAGDDDGRVYLAMQLVDGITLGEALAGGPTVPQILRWFVAAGRGLEAAHAVGLVHRDFKPSNVLIDRTGRVAVTDFGLAHDVVAQDRSLAGTPAYMSPEQHAAQVITPASDQFSFCVALWEALFHRHPYVESFERESMSPFAVGYAICDAPLIPPPKRARVSKPVTDALVRGLSRLPTTRWPSMTELIAVLEPPARVRVWPMAVAATVAAAAVTGGAVWYALGDRDAAASPCANHVANRVAEVWNPARAQALDARFAASGKSYAHVAAAASTIELDRYASRWQAGALESCSAQEGPSPRSDCLDSRFDEFRAVVTKLTTEPRVGNVDHGPTIVRGLPDLAECGDSGSRPRVPAALADQARAIDHAIDDARTVGNSGDFEGSRAQLVALAHKADALGWAPVQAYAHLALAELLASMLVPAGRDEAFRAAELALGQHLDRLAARAWLAEIRLAGYQRSADLVTAIGPMVRGLAARLNDPVLAYEAEVAYGRALVVARRVREGAEVCRAARKLMTPSPEWPDDNDARDCLVEALMPLGAYSELEPLLGELLAERTKQLGPDHPVVSDYLGAQSGLLQLHGKLDEALAISTRVLAIRQRAYPAGHLKIADALRDLGDIYSGKGDEPHAQELYSQALVIASKVEPPPLVLLGALHTARGFALEKAHDHAGAIAHFEEALAVTRKGLGSSSLELATLLLNYGQIRAVDNLDAAIGMVGEAKTILDRLHDKRANATLIVEGVILSDHKRWPEARRLLEQALDHLDADTDPDQVATAKWILAKALVETHGEHSRARKLASEARTGFVAVGPSEASSVKAIDAWLAKQ